MGAHGFAAGTVLAWTCRARVLQAASQTAAWRAMLSILGWRFDVDKIFVGEVAEKCALEGGQLEGRLRVVMDSLSLETYCISGSIANVSPSHE
jgi:hypothetical protein